MRQSESDFKFSLLIKKLLLAQQRFI